jgi:CelD/BcsL family acetyltransferase involved in cellulose biosynthesis
MLTVRTLTTLPELHGLAEGWRRLAACDANASLCSSWQWVSVWLQQFWLPHFQLQVLLVEQNTASAVQLVAILPLYLNQQSQELLLLGTGEAEGSEVASEYLDLLIDEAHVSTAEVLSALLPALSVLPFRRWRCLNCLASSRVVQLGQQLGRALLQPCGRQYGIAVPSTVNELIAGFRPNTQKRARLLLNRFDKAPELRAEFAVQDSNNTLWQGLQTLHQADWTERNKAGAFASPNFQRFHELLQQSQGELRYCFTALWHQDELIAAHYYYCWRQRWYYYQSGAVKERFGRYSPGLLLHLLTLRHLLGSGCYYDFMKGAISGGYKAPLCPPGELFYHQACYGPGFANGLRYLAASAKQWLRSKLR